MLLMNYLANQYQRHRGDIGGFCPLRIRGYSGGLKSILGSWLCQGLGFVTWRPPVNQVAGMTNSLRLRSGAQHLCAGPSLKGSK